MSDTPDTPTAYSEYEDSRSVVLGLMMTDCLTRHTGMYPCPCWESAIDALESFEQAVRHTTEGPATA